MRDTHVGVFVLHRFLFVLCLHGYDSDDSSLFGQILFLVLTCSGPMFNFDSHLQR